MNQLFPIVNPAGDHGSPYPHNWLAADENVYRNQWWATVQPGQTVRWTRTGVRDQLLVSVFLIEEADTEWAVTHSGAEKPWHFDHRGLRARLVPQESWEAHRIDLEVGLTAVAA